MKRREWLAGLGALGVLGACKRWGVEYNDTAKFQASDWSVRQLNVAASPALQTSLKNGLLPDADIVWWDELPQDETQRFETRRLVVRQVLANNVEAVVQTLDGPRDVRMDVNLQRFHGLTPLLGRFNIVGVHNVVFDVTVYDYYTGEKLAESRINADTPARDDGSGADNTQRVGQTIQRALAGWLGLADDTRERFRGIGF